MVDWWAYVADVLTFYNERIANEDYLRTAHWIESVAHLVQTLGYRPRPALGAKGVVAGLLGPGARPPIAVPQGLQIQSKSGPGKTPQVFEADAATNVGAPDVLVADVVPDKSPLLGADGKTLWLAGKVSGVKPGDRLLLIEAKAVSAQSFSAFAWIKVVSLTPKSDPLGAAVTEMAFAPIAQAGLSGALAADYILVKSRQSSPLWSYLDAGKRAAPAKTAYLAGLARGTGVGALILIDIADNPPVPSLILDPALADGGNKAAIVAKDATVSFQNAASQGLQFENARSAMPASAAPLRSSASLEVKPSAFAGAVQESPLGLGGAIGGGVFVAPNPVLGPTPAIVIDYSEIVAFAGAQVNIPISVLTYPELTGVTLPAASAVTIRWDWLPVGVIVPVLTTGDYAYPTGGSKLVATQAGGAFKAASNAVTVLLEDANGVAAAAGLTAAGDQPAAILAALAPPPTPPGLASPIEAFFNLIPLSRGKTVASEVLGSGDTRIAGQDFTLVKSPVTYFSDPQSVSGDNFSSTVQVSVNGVQWREVRNFYGLGPTAQVFVLREDDQGQTHVTFGDGINGARLPTGVGNVVAAYRFGAGGEAPAAETLTTVLSPIPGLRGVRNPLPPTGGADPDSLTHMRTLAPASVLTLGRCVSLDDFAVTAAGAGGVTQAAASFAVDPVSQRPMTTLYVAGDSGAVASASAALAGAGAAMANVRVLPAVPFVASLTVVYLRDPRYAYADVSQRLAKALLDPDTGLLGANVLGIGQPIYDSQIAALSLGVGGVAAVTSIAFRGPPPPIQRAFFVDLVVRRPGGLHVPFPRPAPNSPRHDPGVGRYFVVPNDPAHVSLAGSLAS
jgi:hypothetical protein